MDEDITLDSMTPDYVTTLRASISTVVTNCRMLTCEAYLIKSSDELFNVLYEACEYLNQADSKITMLLKIEYDLMIGHKLSELFSSKEWRNELTTILGLINRLSYSSMRLSKMIKR